MKLVYGINDGEMFIMDADGDTVHDWNDIAITIEDLWVILCKSESLALDSFEDRIRFMTNVAKEAIFIEQITEEKAPDPGDFREHDAEGQFE